MTEELTQGTAAPASRTKRAAAGAAHDESTATPSPDLNDPSLYINRELSCWPSRGACSRRPTTSDNPLLERVKFLSIFSSNLAEFFMVRIAGLQQQVEAGVADVSADGLTPAEQLGACRDEALRAHARGAPCAVATSRCRSWPRPASYILDYEELDDEQRAAADAYFDEHGLPGAHAAGVRPRPAVPAHLQPEPQPRGAAPRERDEQRFARVKMPPIAAAARAGAAPPKATRRGRQGAPYDFVWLEQLIAANLDELFPGMDDRRARTPSA